MQGLAQPVRPGFRVTFGRNQVLANLEGDETGFYRAKLDTARFFFDRLMPQAGSLLATITAGAGSTMRFEDDAFARVA